MFRSCLTVRCTISRVQQEKPANSKKTNVAKVLEADTYFTKATMLNVIETCHWLTYLPVVFPLFLKKFM